MISGTKTKSLIFISLEFQERREGSAEKVFEEIVTENPQNLVEKLSKPQRGKPKEIYP